MKKSIISFCLIFSGILVFGGGYRVSLQGVRQAAMGAQGTAFHHDASVAFFNPAALAFVDKKVSIALGGFGVLTTSKYQDPSTLKTAETDNPLGTPLYFAASYKPTEKLALGFSFTTPFGSTVDWGEEWTGRYTINKMELKSFFFQPTIAYKFNDWISFGGGFIIARGEANITRSVQVGAQDSQMELDVDGAKGTGMNLGVFLMPSEKMTIGLSYRSEVKIEAREGDVSFTNLPTAVSSTMPFAATNFDVDLNLPAELLFGITYKVSPKLLLATEIGVLNWETYKELVLELYNSSSTYTSASQRGYKNTMNISLGAEYALKDNLALRLGYKFDESPSPNEYFTAETPTVDYHAFTGGLGYTMNKLTIDLMAEYLHGTERNFNNIESNFGGQLRTTGFLFGLGLSYNVGSFNSKK